MRAVTAGTLMFARPGYGIFPPTSDCTDKSLPVLKGVDFVDLLENKKESVDVPEFGVSSVTSTLNGYTFWFKNTANRDKFAADPWAYAPAFGGF